MSDTRITVMAYVHAKEEMKKEVEKELLKLVAPTRSEPGCIVYDLYRSAERKTLFMFYECWRSKGDLDEHLQKPYIKDFMKKAIEMLSEPVEVSLWERLSE